MRKNILLFFWFLLFSQNIFSANWTILSYIQADNNLYDYVLQDISEMSVVGSNENVNILAQIDTPENNGTWRYKVEKGKVELEAHLQNEMGVNPGQELQDAASWAFKTYPAENNMIVLSSHGYGIIDPQMRKMMRSVLFDDTQNSYLGNQQLATAMGGIKTILGKNLDILGMDACLMAMFEIGYQVKDSVNYLVASEESEAAQGWYYSGFLPSVASGYCSPITLASSIVSSYGDFYKNRNNYYTQSAVDLAKMELLKDNINKVVTALNDCNILQRTKVVDIVKQARSKSLQFSVSDYIDLHSFYSQLFKQVDELNKQDSLPSNPRPSHGRPRPPRGELQDDEEFEEELEEDFDEELRRPSPRPRPTSPRPQPGSSNPLPTIASPRPSVNSSPRPNYSRPTSSRPRPSSIIQQVSAKPSQTPQVQEKPKTELDKKIDILKEALSDGMKLIENVVVANVAGSQAGAAKGLSIYFPKKSIHSSYAKTKFAQDSLWLDFLVENV